MTLNDRVLHHTMAGCTDPQRAGEIVEEINEGYAVKWVMQYPSGIKTTYVGWYEPQELVPFVEAEIEVLDKQRELVYEFTQVIEQEAKSA